MRISQLGWILALAALLLSTAAAAGGCQLLQLGELPVDMQGPHPLVWTKINGVKARFELDTGSFYSILWSDAAVHYQLPITRVPDGGPSYIIGAGGSERARIATVKSFEFLAVPVPKAVQFLVIDQSLGSETVGLLGQNMLRMSDVEYDLANGIVRFFKPAGCERQPLAYWAVSTPYSSVELESMDAFESHLRAAAMVNGHRITAEFDTGSPRSYLSLEAAHSAGILPTSPGVTFLGLGGGIGPGSNKTWSAPVDSFQLGGEKVQHTHLLISGRGPDLLLGADFFLSHRIYVAYSQKKLYFTYNGGPLFNLNIPQVASGAAKPPATPDTASQATAARAGQPESDAPADADGFRRRGMAFAATREFDRALADLTRACDLAPRDTENRYQRGVIYAEDGQFKSALRDFNTVIALQPDDIDAHMARAELLQSHPDTDADATPELKADLDAVSRFATPAARVRLTVAGMYAKLGEYPAAIDQIDQWLSQHPLPGDRITGFNTRCWIRATVNRDLREALDDCNRALNLGSYTDPDIRDSRALVYLRLGRTEDAIYDYSTALHGNPRMPSSLYGRGLAELRLGEKAQGQDDLAAAEKLDSGIAKYFAKIGLAP